MIISTYYDECLGLARKLSQSDSRIDISRRLQARIGEYTTILPRAQPAMAARHARMPYRTFMGQVAERLRTTYDGRPNHYENVGQFFADIELVAESLRENHGRHAGLFHVELLIRRARTFGFHLATLDVRQHADVHRAVVGQGMGDADWLQRDRTERARILAEAVTRDRGPTGPLDPVGRRTLAVFEAMLQARQRLYVGFLCHLVIEKTLKGYWARVKKGTPPFTHDLSLLAERTKTASRTTPAAT